MKRLPAFTTALLGQLLPFDHALLVADEVVFDPPQPLVELRHEAGERRPVREIPGHAFHDREAEVFRACLEATLSGWIDFRVLFSPPRHAVRADHDEYTTFFSQSPGKVADWRAVLVRSGERVVEWTAENP